MWWFQYLCQGTSICHWHISGIYSLGSLHLRLPLWRITVDSTIWESIIQASIFEGVHCLRIALSLSMARERTAKVWRNLQRSSLESSEVFVFFTSKPKSMKTQESVRNSIGESLLVLECAHPIMLRCISLLVLDLFTCWVWSLSCTLCSWKIPSSKTKLCVRMPLLPSRIVCCV